MKMKIAVSALLMAFLTLPMFAQQRPAPRAPAPRATLTAHQSVISWNASIAPGVRYRLQQAPCPAVTGGTAGPNGSVSSGTCAAPGTFVTVGTTTVAGVVTLTSSGLTAATSYAWQVIADCSAPGATCAAGTQGQSVPSNTTAGTTQFDIVAPDAPANVTVTAIQ